MRDNGHAYQARNHGTGRFAQGRRKPSRGSRRGPAKQGPCCKRTHDGHDWGCPVWQGSDDFRSFIAHAMSSGCPRPGNPAEKCAVAPEYSPCPVCDK
jgi:hypothetical protein